MPLGVMVMLMPYTLRGPSGGSARELLWLAAAVLITVGLHLWRGQALLSILVGTAVYVTLMSVW
jgi:branched-subunit amino acid transport protein AzlD